MRIEDELLTTKFPSSIHKAHFNVIFSAGWVRTRISSHLKPFGITFEQYSVMRIVRNAPPEGIRVKDITHRMLDRSSNTTRIIDRLVQKKVLLRLSSERDGRERSIVLTPHGNQVIQAIEQTWEERSPYASQLSAEEALMLSDLLDKLRERPINQDM